MQIRRTLFAVTSLAVLLMVVPLSAAKKKSSKSGKEKSRAESKQKESNAARKSVSSTPLSKILKLSQRVDKLVEAGYAKHQVEPNPPASDEVFLRRIYLDLVGRIPNYEEAKSFLDSKDKQRRSKLIDTLLDSEGYVSHQYNYWADLLRIQTRMRYAPSKPYIDFVKNSLRDNKPYDQFVRELITAEGYTWDNGAAGYYLRDTGMPLDNMSNTAQVFLGTQLVCAQCHDHPFDSWTQKQYYQLAAFTYGVETRDRRLPISMEIRKMLRDGEIEREVMRSANRILQPLNYRVHETDKALRLPKDYQYEDAKPRDTIDPATIFGDSVEVPEDASRAEIYARWMTSPTNPRFSNVIANRLWKRAMGVGLVEPVDDFKDGVNPSNPELMQFLVKQMVGLNFNLKQYLRVLYNTKTYQREVTEVDLVADETYHFPGPVLRRMSAEQLWDSMLTLIVPELDARTGSPRNYNRYADGKELIDKKSDEILVMAKERAKARAAQVKYNELTKDLQKKMRIATRVNDRDKVNKLRSEMSEIRAQVFVGAAGEQMRKQRSRASRNRRETDPRWLGLSKDLVRAAEVESPARPGHFLRQFGQSDRETIENANTEATVPQILTLLNGPMFAQLTNRQSVLTKNVEAAETTDEKLDAIFLSIFNRRPTEREREITGPELEADRNGTANVVWALLNTRQFIFVQ